MSEKRYMRDAVGDVLRELGEADPHIVVLDADLGHSTRAAAFGERFPERYFQMGIAEQNMVGAAAGLAAEGHIVFVSTFAIFGSRAWEQIRLCVAYSGLDVKFLFTHAGLATGPDGASHQMTEDIALMASLPGMRVFSPSDYFSAAWAIRRAYEEPGPCYVRMVRPKSPLIYREETRLSGTFVHGEGSEVALITTGLLTPAALEALEILEKEGIAARVFDVISIKPMETPWLNEDFKAMVVAEDHVAWGGLFSGVARSLVLGHRSVGVRALNAGDSFGHSASPADIYKEFGFTPENIARLAKEALEDS